MRFLHLADVHLDAPFAVRSAPVRRRLRLAAREALRAAVDCALSERVDALLLAGDLFDGERLSLGTELFLLAELERLRVAGVPVVYACGNHDPGSDARRALAWPSNVTVAGAAEPLRLPVRRGGELVGYVTAAGHASARETADLSRAFPRPAGQRPEVALLHTQVMGARSEQEHQPYAPSRLEWLRESGYHYWALGHVHLRQCLSASPGVHYPGCLQGRTARERGAKGGLLVDLAEPAAPRVRFRSFAPVRFETLEVDGLEVEGTLHGVVARVAGAWEAQRAADEPAASGAGPGQAQATPPPEWMVRVVLVGPCPLARELDDEEERLALASALREALGVLDVALWTRSTLVRVSAAEHRGRQDLLGGALRLLQAVLAGEETLPGVRAEDLASPEAREDLEGWVRALLSDAEGELLARLLARETP